MYTLNTTRTTEGIVCTVPDDDYRTDKYCGCHVATIEYLPVGRRTNPGRSWLVILKGLFAHHALDCNTFYSLEAAQYCVLSAYVDYRARESYLNQN